ncbi:MAG: hypothetical protein ABIB71_00160 [Candidatus Woesearchaeota archaeon]
MHNDKFVRVSYLLIILVLTSLWVISILRGRWLDFFVWAGIFAVVVVVPLVILGMRKKILEKPKPPIFKGLIGIFKRKKESKAHQKEHKQGLKSRIKKRLKISKTEKGEDPAKKVDDKVKVYEEEKQEEEAAPSEEVDDEVKLKLYKKGEEEKAAPINKADDKVEVKVYKGEEKEKGAAPAKKVDDKIEVKVYKEEKKEKESVSMPIKGRVELVEINKPREDAKTSKRNVKTAFDQLFEYVEEKGEVKFSEVEKKFNLPKDKVSEWAKLLEEHDLVEVIYPTFGEPKMKRREK